MEWSEYQKQRSANINLSKWEITEIICPECGEPVYRDKSIVLTSYPVQYSYNCLNCGWHDYGY